MKVVCSKEKLVEGINIVQKAVSSKSTQQILEGILLIADSSLKLTGSDLEIGIECCIEADIMNEGSIVINSRMFGDIVRKLPDSEVLIEVIENDKVIIECDNSHFEIKGIEPHGYPSLPYVESDNSYCVLQNVLRDMIRQTIFSVSVDENRSILTGLLIESKDNNLILVGIDGFRMALRRKYSMKIDSEFRVIVPGKTMNEIVKILQQSETEMSIISSKNFIMFDIGNVKIISKLIDGEYLNYNTIIPDEFETKVVVNTKEMLYSLERASLISNEEKKFPVKLTIDDNKIIISSKTEIGAVREEVHVIDMNGERLDVGFNPRYLIDALKVIDDEKVTIVFSSDVGPCTLKPISSNNFSYMILPVRLKSEA